MALVILPYMYIPDPTRGRPVFNGKIYIGEVDTDPRIESNQKAALLVQEDGSRVEAEYPIQINSGGIPTYNGSPVAIDVAGEYAIAIDSKDDQQVYYFARAGTDTENLTTDLRSVMFDFGLLYEDIGSTLVSSSAGTLLDEARLILDINSGRVLDLPTSIPTGSVVVSLTDFTLVTNNGQFTLNQAWSNTVENRFKGNQNWNVEGGSGKPVPSATPTDYNVGEEVAAGIEVITTNALGVTLVDGVLKSTNAPSQGVLRRRYAKDPAGLITKTSQYGGIKLPDGSQLQALADDIATNGVRITEDGSDVVVDVDLSVVTGGFRFFGLSDERGAWADVNDEDSLPSVNINDNGLNGNYEVILAIGNYTSGTYFYPNGHTENDYSKIELMISQADSLFYGSSSMYAEMIAQPWANHRVQPTAGDFAQMTRLSSTSFSVTVGGGLGVKMIIGYLKEGVI